MKGERTKKVEKQNNVSLWAPDSQSRRNSIWRAERGDQVVGVDIDSWKSQIITTYGAESVITVVYFRSVSIILQSGSS